MGAVCFAFLWVPASAGMTGLLTLTLALSRRGRGDVPGPACAGMTEGWRGNDGLFTLTLGPPS